MKRSVLPGLTSLRPPIESLARALNRRHASGLARSGASRLYLGPLKQRPARHVSMTGSCSVSVDLLTPLGLLPYLRRFLVSLTTNSR